METNRIQLILDISKELLGEDKFANRLDLYQKVIDEMADLLHKIAVLDDSRWERFKFKYGVKHILFFTGYSLVMKQRAIKRSKYIDQMAILENRKHPAFLSHPLVQSIILMQQTHQLLSGNANQPVEAVNQAFAKFISISERPLKRDISDAGLSIEEKLSLLTLMKQILNNKRFSQDETIKQTFCSLGFTILDLAKDPGYFSMRSSRFKQINIAMGKQRENNHQQVIEEGVSAFIDIHFEPFVEFMIKDKTIFYTDEMRKILYSTLMSEFKHIYNIRTGAWFTSYAEACFYNAVIEYAIETAEQMRKHLDHDTISWMRNAKKFDMQNFYTKFADAINWTSDYIGAVVSVGGALSLYYHATLNKSDLEESEIESRISFSSTAMTAGLIYQTAKLFTEYKMGGSAKVWVRPTLAFKLPEIFAEPDQWGRGTEIAETASTLTTSSAKMSKYAIRDMMQALIAELITNAVNQSESRTQQNNSNTEKAEPMIVDESDQKILHKKAAMELLHEYQAYIIDKAHEKTYSLFDKQKHAIHLTVIQKFEAGTLTTKGELFAAMISAVNGFLKKESIHLAFPLSTPPKEERVEEEEDKQEEIKTVPLEAVVNMPHVQVPAPTRNQPKLYLKQKGPAVSQNKKSVQEPLITFTYRDKLRDEVIMLLKDIVSIATLYSKPDPDRTWLSAKYDLIRMCEALSALKQHGRPLYDAMIAADAAVDINALRNGIIHDDVTSDDQKRLKYYLDALRQLSAIHVLDKVNSENPIVDVSEQIKKHAFPVRLTLAAPDWAVNDAMKTSKLKKLITLISHYSLEYNNGNIPVEVNIAEARRKEFIMAIAESAEIYNHLKGAKISGGEINPDMIHHFKNVRNAFDHYNVMKSMYKAPGEGEPVNQDLAYILTNKGSIYLNREPEKKRL